MIREKEINLNRVLIHLKVSSQASLQVFIIIPKEDSKPMTNKENTKIIRNNKRKKESNERSKRSKASLSLKAADLLPYTAALGGRR